MTDRENTFAELNRINAFYAPVIGWCHSLDNPHDGRDIVAEFYAALDAVVRDDDFSVRDLSRAIGGNWWSDTADPEIAADVNRYCQRAWVVREYLEVRGEARRRPLHRVVRSFPGMRDES